MKKKNFRDAAREAKKSALPSVRGLVSKFGLPAVNGAVKMIYDERTAQRQLKAAEQKVAELKKKVSR